MNILQLENVRKTYEKKVAVDDVSFVMPKGCIFGLLGPNGAGKTSLIRIITTITGADSGQILLDGEPIGADTPSQIGYMPEERGLYKKMKVGEQLLYLAQLKGLNKATAKELIMGWFTKFDIEDWWDKKVEELSKGMQQKIQFISTVVHKPKLLILDEPFSGLDPLNTNLIKDEIRQLKAEGSSIIFSTHRMEQVEEICENIVLINNGENVLEGDVNDIKNTYKDNIYQIEYEGILPEEIKSIGTVQKDEKGLLRIKLKDETLANKMLATMVNKGLHIVSYNEIFPTLNEIFIKTVDSQN